MRGFCPGRKPDVCRKPYWLEKCGRAVLPASCRIKQNPEKTVKRYITEKMYIIKRDTYTGVRTGI